MNRSRTGRSHFTPTDDKNIFLYVIDILQSKSQLVNRPFGNEFWKLANDKKITAHSYQSMLGRFKRVLLPSIDSTVLLNDQQKALIKEKLRLYLPKKETGENSRMEESSSPSSKESSDSSVDDDEDEDVSGRGDGPLCVSCDVASDTDRKSPDNNREGEEVAKPTVGKTLFTRCTNEGSAAAEEIGVRSRFSFNDDIEMLKFVAKELETHNPNGEFMKGDQLWRLAEEKGVTNHPARAMRDRFRKYLLPKLDELDIADDLKQFLVKRIAAFKLPPRGASSVCSSPPRKKPALAPAPSPAFLRDSSVNDDASNEDGIEKENVEESSTSKVQVSKVRDAVNSVIFSMAKDGTLTSMNELRRFTAILDKLVELSEAHNVGLKVIVNLMKRTADVTEIQEILAKGGTE